MSSHPAHEMQELSIILVISSSLFLKALTNVIFGNIDTSSVTTMKYLFSNCESLSTIDLSALDFSNVKDISNMFYGCNYLNKVIFGDIDTSSVSDMESLFSGCSSIEYLNPSVFSLSAYKG